MSNPYQPPAPVLTDKTQPRADQRRHWRALGMAMAYPTLLTWAYFVLLRDAPAAVQQSVYALGKTVQFVFPVVWVYWVWRQPWARPLVRRQGLGIGLAFGTAVLLAMLGLFLTWLKNSEYGPGLDAQAVEKVRDLGLDSLWKYGAVAVFYALAHSLLEEYYWRWFVFQQLRKVMPLWPAVFVSGIAFTLHHIVVLFVFFKSQFLLIAALASAVAIGGWFWAWLYSRNNSIFDTWFSHLLIDAGIFFGIGYELVRHSFVVG